MPLTIRSAAPTDEDAVTELWRRCDLVAPYNDPAADFRFALAGAMSDVLVATAEGGDIVGNADGGGIVGKADGGGGIVGSAMVGHDGHRGWVYYVASSPLARGQGIGREMIRAAEAWLRERGVLKLQLLVRETNTQVVSFYEHLGFEVSPRTVMAKWL